MFVAIFFLFFAASEIRSGIARQRSLIHVLEHLDTSGKSVSSFFPTYSSPPPPPATIISIPANISSISVPKSPESKPTSHKLLLGGAAALAAATLFGAVSAFCFYRRKRKHRLPDDKSIQFTTTLRPMYSSNGHQSLRRNRMEKAASNSTSDFLYLGTVVNSRGTTVNEVSQRSKLASPDLHPLPPLDRFSYKENRRNAVEMSDEEEEFYSPKAVSESGLKLETEEISNSIGPSSSSSASSSPRSISLTISPFSRQSSTPKSASVHIFPPPPSPPTTNNEPSRLSPTIPKPPPLLAPSKPFINTAKQASSSSDPPSNEATTPRLKLKALHWDKVKANPDREMVWDQLKSSSFKLNEEMMETLFVVNSSNDVLSRSALNHEAVRVLDPKKAQNIAILLKALNVTIEEVREALEEGDRDMLGNELLECLMKMAPTREEERRLNEYKDNSPYKLGAAENFLKNILSIPFAFKRVDAMLYAANFNSEIEYLKKSFQILQSACEELKNSRMFMKLLEAVLKTGNRMNNGTIRGDAEAFKLDTLLKLVDVKGADGKTTLLHFVVQEIARTEGARLSDEASSSSSSSSSSPCNPNEELRRRKLGLQVVSALSHELINVKKAASMDSDVLSGDLSKLPRGIREVSEIVRLIEGRSEMFAETMRRFMAMAEEEVLKIQQVERVAIGRVKEVTEYFHGNAALEEARPFRIFMVVRDFLGILDRVCKEVWLIKGRTVVSSGHNFPVPVKPGVVASD